jgi:hypothetical protein
MNRNLFYKIVKESLTPDERVLYLTTEITDALLAETDETELLNRCQNTLDSYFDSQFNLIEYNMQAAQSLLQLCINYRKELKDLEVQIINKAVQRRTIMLRQEFEQNIRLVRNNHLTTTSGQLAKQSTLQTENGLVTGVQDSQLAVLTYEKEGNELSDAYQDNLMAVENEVLQLGLDESVGMNYLARYQQLKTVYNERVADLYRLIKNVYLGGALMYPLNVRKPPTPRPNYFLYDCNNWLQQIIERVNERQASYVYSTATFSVKSNNPAQLNSIRNSGQAMIPELFAFHGEMIELDTLECCIKDGDTGIKQDFWYAILELGLRPGILIENPMAVVSTIDTQQWQDMITTTKNVRLVFKIPNTTDLLGSSSFTIVGLKNVLASHITIKLSLVQISINGKSSTSIEDIFFFVRGKAPFGH